MREDQSGMPMRLPVFLNRSLTVPNESETRQKGLAKPSYFPASVSHLPMFQIWSTRLATNVCRDCVHIRDQLCDNTHNLHVLLVLPLPFAGIESCQRYLFERLKDRQGKASIYAGGGQAGHVGVNLHRHQ
jgi:hypothetical protein